MNIGNSNWNN